MGVHIEIASGGVGTGEGTDKVPGGDGAGGGKIATAKVPIAGQGAVRNSVGAEVDGSDVGRGDVGCRNCGVSEGGVCHAINSADCQVMVHSQVLNGEVPGEIVGQDGTVSDGPAGDGVGVDVLGFDGVVRNVFAGEAVVAGFDEINDFRNCGSARFSRSLRGGGFRGLAGAVAGIDCGRFVAENLEVGVGLLWGGSAVDGERQESDQERNG